MTGQCHAASVHDAAYRRRTPSMESPHPKGRVESARLPHIAKEGVLAVEAYITSPVVPDPS